MNVELLYRPAYSLGLIHLDPNEEVRVEAASMVMMSDGVILETGATGGFFKSLARTFVGESFFQNTFKAPAGGGVVGVAPSLPGDLFVLELSDENMLVQSGSYLASEMGLTTDAKWKGAKTFISSEGLIMLRVTGRGKLLLSSYGAIHELNLAAGQRMSIDTGHLVAFSEQIGYKVRPIGGIKSTLFSGEGLVIDLTGPGRVLMQTRSTDQFLDWLIPKIPRSTTTTSSSGD